MFALLESGRGVSRSGGGGAGGTDVGAGGLGVAGGLYHRQCGRMLTYADVC